MDNDPAYERYTSRESPHQEQGERKRTDRLRGTVSRMSLKRWKDVPVTDANKNSFLLAFHEFCLGLTLFFINSPCAPLSSG